MVSSLRSYFRQQRRQLSQNQQKQHAVLLAQHVSQFLRLKSYTKIAIYLPNDGEISPLELMDSKVKRQFYLPVLSQLNFQGLCFARYSIHSRFTFNKFNIKEPIVANKELLTAQQLDVIFLPLVAFDSNGNRMGMGGGFYDRALKIRQSRPSWRKPFLVGLAHSCQQTKSIQAEHWDIPLDAIATENGVIYFKNS